MPHTDCGRSSTCGSTTRRVLPDAGDPPERMEAAWRFCGQTAIYRERQEVRDKPGPSIRPLRADGTMPGPRLADLNGEGYGRALAPLRKALGAATELEDLAWFTAAEILARQGRRTEADRLRSGRCSPTTASTWPHEALPATGYHPHGCGRGGGGLTCPSTETSGLQRRDAPLGEIRIGTSVAVPGKDYRAAGGRRRLVHYRPRRTPTRPPRSTAARSPCRWTQRRGKWEVITDKSALDV